MVRKKSDKVVPFTPIEIEDVIESEEFDPREHMTPEQIQEFIREEEEMLNRRIGKFISEVPKPDTGVLEEEDDEDTEVFSVNFENHTVEQKVEGLIVGDEGLIQKVLAESNPYTKLMTDIYVSKAIGDLLKKIRAEQDKIDELADAAFITGHGKALSELSRSLYDKQVQQLKGCWITGTNQVRYDRIPDWATTHINQYITDSLTKIIYFIED